MVRFTILLMFICPPYLNLKPIIGTIAKTRRASFYPNVNVCPDGWQQVAPNYRYYCQDPEGYYPDVDVCPDGWQQVAPQPDDD